jgi:bacillopeptidase F (M6 metalloprotease family)
MEEDANVVAASQVQKMESQIQNKMSALNLDIPSSEMPPSQENTQGDKEMVAGDIINSQESVITDDGQNREMMVCDKLNDNKMKKDGQAMVTKREGVSA